MKRIIFLTLFILIGFVASAQNSMLKTRWIKTLTSSYSSAGTDSVVFSLQPNWGYALQIRPTLGSGCDSIYTSVKMYVSNSDGDAAWTPIADINDTYTASSDTLVTANSVLNAAWMTYATTFQYVRVKVVLLCLDNTNEDNQYRVYLVAKPTYVWNEK
jgi:hypothetical protein